MHTTTSIKLPDTRFPYEGYHGYFFEAMGRPLLPGQQQVRGFVFISLYIVITVFRLNSENSDQQSFVLRPIDRA